MACTGPQMFGFNGNTVTAPAGKYAGANLAFTLVSGQVTASPVLVPSAPHRHRRDVPGAAERRGESELFVPDDSGSPSRCTPAPLFTMPDGTKPNPFPLSAVYVPTDRLPDAKPFQPTMLAAFFVSFQPAGTSASQPAAVSFPNTLNTAPGTTSIPLMALDPNARHHDPVRHGHGFRPMGRRSCPTPTRRIPDISMGCCISIGKRRCQPSPPRTPRDPNAPVRHAARLRPELRRTH